jgi:hypothetical protein
MEQAMARIAAYRVALIALAYLSVLAVTEFLGA